MSHVEYRDYVGAKASLCDSEPRWLSDELSSVNGMLSRFLDSTEDASKPEGPRHAAHLNLLKEATGSLPRVMEVHRQNLQALRDCSFRRAGAFPEIARRGAELLKLTQARLDEAPAALAAEALREAQRKWRDEAPAREASARQTWCTANPQVGGADLYFAREYPDGRTEWLFCDGLRVEATAGGEPQLITPDDLSRRERRRIQPQRYLDAAKSYPSKEMDRQPNSLPSPATQKTEQASRGS